MFCFLGSRTSSRGALQFVRNWTQGLVTLTAADSAPTYLVASLGFSMGRDAAQFDGLACKIGNQKTSVFVP